MSKCIECQFYDRKHSRQQEGRAALWGQCRRQAPQLNPNNVKTYAIEGIWPVVRDDDWCGEWRAQHMGLHATDAAVRTPVEPVPRLRVSAMAVGVGD